jgi:iron(III) transport system ATP-binding protein
MNKLSISNLRHRNSEIFSLRIDRLEAEPGSIVCLLGPSGCGKTTTLRLVAGLERPDSGQITIGGEPVAGPEQFVGAEDRRVGLVFQDYALFPHLTVLGNVLFGLSRGSRSARRTAALALLSRLGLDDQAGKYPHMLSGGEQQRVALARALAPNPRLILMDEPFSGLDVVLRNRVRDETLALLKETGTTVLLVTHDPEEAMRMGDKIILMRDGHVEQAGSPTELYRAPCNAFVAEFLGDVNRVRAMSVDGALQSELGPVTGLDSGHVSGDCEILVRPEAIRLSPQPRPGMPVGRVIRARHLGPYILVALALPSGQVVTARSGTYMDPQAGEDCALSLDSRKVFLFPESSAR